MYLKEYRRLPVHAGLLIIRGPPAGPTGRSEALFMRAVGRPAPPTKGPDRPLGLSLDFEMPAFSRVNYTAEVPEGPLRISSKITIIWVTEEAIKSKKAKPEALPVEFPTQC